MFQRKPWAQLWLALALIGSALASPDIFAAGSKDSRFSDEPIPYLGDKELPQRTAPLLEVGDAFLDAGNLKPGFVLPTGAVWQPRLWVYGTARSSLGSHRVQNGPTVTQWANRLDLFGNLQLTGTERLLVGIQPIHIGRNFSGYSITPDDMDGGDEFLNLRMSTLFFEGDIAEIFPRWDPTDKTSNDIGFSVGRQSVVFQDGMLVNDTLDAFGLTRNNVRFDNVAWLINLRTTFLYAWGDTHRDDNAEDPSTEIYALFTSIDTIKSTFNFDIAYADSDERGEGDLLAFGFDAIQRFGKFSTTLRALGSVAIKEKSLVSENGVLLFGDINWTPAYSQDLAYVTVFAGFDRYTSTARDPLAGGPLGRAGLLFSARGIGSFPSPLSNRAGDAYGGAVGYQFQMLKSRRQLTFETGARKDNAELGTNSYGVAGRFQQAFGRRGVFTLEGFGTLTTDRKPGVGIRTELLLKL